MLDKAKEPPVKKSVR